MKLKKYEKVLIVISSLVLMVLGGLYISFKEAFGYANLIPLFIFLVALNIMWFDKKIKYTYKQRLIPGLVVGGPIIILMIVGVVVINNLSYDTVFSVFGLKLEYFEFFSFYNFLSMSIFWLAYSITNVFVLPSVYKNKIK